jgi:hypothetical protein
MRGAENHRRSLARPEGAHQRRCLIQAAEKARGENAATKLDYLLNHLFY